MTDEQRIDHEETWLEKMQRYREPCINDFEFEQPIFLAAYFSNELQKASEALKFQYKAIYGIDIAEGRDPVIHNCKWEEELKMKHDENFAEAINPNNELKERLRCLHEMSEKLIEENKLDEIKAKEEILKKLRSEVSGAGVNHISNT